MSRKTIKSVSAGSGQNQRKNNLAQIGCFGSSHFHAHGPLHVASLHAAARVVVIRSDFLLWAAHLAPFCFAVAISLAFSFAARSAFETRAAFIHVWILLECLGVLARRMPFVNLFGNAQTPCC